MAPTPDTRRRSRVAARARAVRPATFFILTSS
jgi:hypothetical protein